jgi:hypothetical protein
MEQRHITLSTPKPNATENEHSESTSSAARHQKSPDFLETEVKGNLTALAKGFCYIGWHNLLKIFLIGFISYLT